MSRTMEAQVQDCVIYARYFSYAQWYRLIYKKKPAPAYRRTAGAGRKEPIMISPEEVRAILQETDREKREKMVDALSEQDAKDIIKAYANFLRRWDEN